MKSKSISVLIFIIAGIILFTFYPSTLFSPGEIHKGHSDIERCETCHEAFTKPSADQCTSVGCHDTADWDKDKGIFTGHIGKSDCLKCHTEHKGVDGDITLSEPHLKILPDSNCLDCHRLGTKHSPVKAQECSKCHSIDKWKPAKFGHDSAKNISDCKSCHPLTKKHFATTANCSECHSIDKWKPAKFDHKTQAKGSDCRSCHPLTKLAKKHFATTANCSDCHSIDKWKPSTFDHRFPMQHETKRKNNTCETCHPVSLDKYDCYSGCHEHTVRNVRREHREEGIREYSDCMKCHPTGREHERRRDYRNDGRSDKERSYRRDHHDDDDDDDWYKKIKRKFDHDDDDDHDDHDDDD